ncbi:13525_t:CDS:1, partial [Ambispora leptoticha]
AYYQEDNAVNNFKLLNNLNEENHKEESTVDKIIKDLNHSTKNNEAFSSLFISNNDFEVLNKIITKINQYRNQKNAQIAKLEADYYLGELRNKNKVDKKFLNEIRKKLTRGLGKDKLAKRWKS